jgi:hypothetical protein
VDDHRVAAGDPFVAAGRSTSLESIQEIVRRTYPQLIEAMRYEETRLARPMTTNEIDAFARGYHAEEYRLEVGRLMAWRVEEPYEEED